MKQTILDDKSSPEVRAFIYQQLSDLEALLPQGANVSIFVEDPNFKKSESSDSKTSKTLDSKNSKLLPPLIAKKPEKELSKKQKTQPKSLKKKVVIHLDTSIGSIAVEKKHDDIYMAIRDAKEDLKDQLSTLQSFLTKSEDRNQIIESVIQQKYLH